MKWIIIPKRDGKQIAIRADTVFDVREFDGYCAVRYLLINGNDVITIDTAASFDAVMKAIGDASGESSNNPSQT